MFTYPDSFEVEPPSIKKAVTPIINNEEEKKKLFGIELGKGLQPFQAACNVCGDNTPLALWISQNWMNDPIVQAVQNTYKETAETQKTLLDKEAIESLLLDMVREKSPGNVFYILDGKDRIKCLELYSKMRGYLQDPSDHAPNVNLNKIVFKFVEAENSKKPIIEEKAIENNELENLNSKSSTKLKLVG